MNFDCPVHRKVLHITRKTARRAARAKGDRMSVYLCDTYHGYHVGHLPAAVKRGDILRSILGRQR